MGTNYESVRGVVGTFPTTSLRSESRGGQAGYLLQQALRSVLTRKPKTPRLICAIAIVRSDSVESRAARLFVPGTLAVFRGLPRLEQQVHGWENAVCTRRSE